MKVTKPREMSRYGHHYFDSMALFTRNFTYHGFDSWDVRVGLESFRGPFSNGLCKPLHRPGCISIWIFHNMMKYMPFNLSYVEFDVPHDGEPLAHASARMIAEGKFDIVGSVLYMMTRDRIEDKLPFLYPIEHIAMSGFVRQPNIGLNKTKRFQIVNAVLAKPFQTQVWVAVALIFVGLRMLRASLSKTVIGLKKAYYLKRGENPESKKKFLNPPIQKGEPRLNAFSAASLTMSIMLAQALIQVHYTSNLKAGTVTMVERTPPFAGLPAIARAIRAGRLTFLTTSLHDHRWERINNSRQEQFRDLREALRINPPVVVKLASDICEMIATSSDRRYVTIYEDINFRVNCGRYYSSVSKVPIQHLSSRSATMVANPSHRRLVRRLNYAIMAGIFITETNRLVQSSCVNSKSCFEKEKSVAKTLSARGRFTYIQSTSIWVLCVVYAHIILLAMAILAVETFLGKVRDRKRKNRIAPLPEEPIMMAEDEEFISEAETFADETVFDRSHEDYDYVFNY